MTKKPAQVFHFDLYGKREDKYSFLNENSIKTIPFATLQPQEPELFFVPKDFGIKKVYDKGFSLNKLFKINSAGIVTARDEFTIHFSKDKVENTITEFLELDNETARIKFNLGKDVRDWSVLGAKTDLINSGVDFSNIVQIKYRPFEYRYTYFTGTSKGFHCMPRGQVMKHLFKKNNISLICPKQVPDNENSGVFISNFISGHKTCSAYNINNIFPLYLYPETTTQKSLLEETARTPNLKMEIVNEIAEKLGIPFVVEKPTTQNLQPTTSFAPIDILDYIYAVLHSPSYREKYKEFLKIDFPRVPFPETLPKFQTLAKLGSELRQIHLLESYVVEKRITQFNIDGDNIVIKPNFVKDKVDLGNVYINENQYFANVPEVAWNFYIGGYQPAQKWLKDRKGRELSTEDIFHYQKIIVALTETDRLMKKIDKIEI